jgi:hypothetical protein
MTSSTQAISPLRQRMIDDMRMRKLEPKTRASYVRAVSKRARFLERSPHTASAEGLHCGASMIVLQVFLRGDTIRAPPPSPQLP